MTGSDSSHTIDTAVRRVVQALIEKYDWVLPRRDELVKLVLSLIQVEDPPADLERVAYSVALYEACRQTEDKVRHEGAYLELMRFIYRIAFLTPELAEDAVQRALILVYEQIDCCRDPAMFLAFAVSKLR
ncbi:MAG: hypothetical protein Kow0063_23610 [Anaerolineae bacterium]